ncbi:MAG: zinc metallopeptidase [Candidatus Bipolaricaulota bacterium]
MSEAFLAFALGFSFLLVASSLGVRVWVRRIVDECKRVVSSSGITGRDFVDRVMESEGLDDVEVKETQETLAGGYLFDRRLVKVPDLDNSSLLVLAVSAHEMSHARQAKARPRLIKTAAFLGDMGVMFSYLFPLFLVLGFVFYFPLIYISLLVYIFIVIIVLVEVPVELDAMRKAVGYLEEYSDLGYNEMSKLKSLLRWAILTRISYLTGGFLILFDLSRGR